MRLLDPLIFHRLTLLESERGLRAVVDSAVSVGDLPMEDAFSLGYAAYKGRIVADTRELQVSEYMAKSQ